MNEEYLRALHKSLKVDDDYDTWINAVQGDEEYLRGLHSYIGVDDDYETWYSSVLDKKKEDTESLSTGETEDSPSEIQTIQGSTVLPEPKALDKDIPATEIPLPTALSQNMSVAGMYGRGEAVDGAPRVEYQRKKAKLSRKEQEEIWTDLGYGEDDYDLIDLTQDEFGERLEGQMQERRVSSDESEDEFQQRKELTGDDTLTRGAETEEQRKIRLEKLDPESVARFDILERASNAYAQEESIISEQLGIDTEAPDKIEIANSKYREALTVYNKFKSNFETDRGEFSQDFVDQKRQEAFEKMSEILSLDSSASSIEDLAAHAEKYKAETESILLDRTLDAAALKLLTKKKTKVPNFMKDGIRLYRGMFGLETKDASEDFFIDFTYTKRATTDAVLGIVNDAVIMAADYIGDPISAEKYQQRKTERRALANLELGISNDDTRGFQETWNDGDKALAMKKLTLMTADSWLPYAAAIVNPASGIALAGTMGTLGTYEAYRDRGDLTELEKNALAWGSGTIEGIITSIGAGNIRRFRSAIGIADDIGRSSIAAKRAAYTKAINYIKPYSTEVARVLHSAPVRGGVVFVREMAAEQLEELSISVGQQALAYAIAFDEFDPYELADVFWTTLVMSKLPSAVTSIKEVKNINRMNIVPSSDNIKKLEDLKGLANDLSSTLKEDLPANEKKIIRNELASVKAEILEMKIDAISQISAMPEAEQNRVIEINKEIRKRSRAAKQTGNEQVKKSSYRQISQLLDEKKTIEERLQIFDDTQRAEEVSTIAEQVTRDDRGVVEQPAQELPVDIDEATPPPVVEVPAQEPTPVAEEPVEAPSDAQVDEGRQVLQTVGDVAVDDNTKETVDKFVGALRNVAPNINVVMHASRDSYNTTHKRADRDVGHFNPATNTINLLVDPENPLNTSGFMLLKHEAVHPIVEALVTSDPKFADSVENKVKGIMNRYAKGSDAQKRVLDHYKRYSGRSDQSLELLTEFLTVFSEPKNINSITRNRTAIEKLVDLLQTIIDRIKGVRDSNIPTSKAEIISLVKDVNKAFSTGSAIDIDKTLGAESKKQAVRSSLEKDSDPENAYQPERGLSPDEVYSKWNDSKNNFIIAENLEHSLELRRMGFVEAYERDGKIYMSTPVKYESYNAGTNVAKIAPKSFITKAPKDKAKKRVYDSLNSLAKFSGYKIEYVDRPDLQFSSTLVIPDSDNKLDENTIVANLAYANERTGAGGFSFVVLETMRRKSPEYINDLYSKIKKGDSEVSKAFNQYLKRYPELTPFKDVSKEDIEFIALANVIQESIDKMMTSAIDLNTENLLSDFQTAFTEAIEKDTDSEIKMSLVPLGENTLMAIESTLGNKKIEFTKDIDNLEKDRIDALVDVVKSNVVDDITLREFVEYMKQPVEINFAGLQKYTMIDAMRAIDLDLESNQSIDIINSSSLISFYANDAILEDIANTYTSLSNDFINAKQKDFELIQDVFFNRKPETSLNESQTRVLDFIKTLDEKTFTASDKALNFSGSVFTDSFIQMMDALVENVRNPRSHYKLLDFVYSVTDDYELAKTARIHHGVLEITQKNKYLDKYEDISETQKVNDFIEDVFDSNLEYFDKAYAASKINVNQLVDAVSKEKTFRDALNKAKSQFDINYEDGVFTIKVETPELKRRFPKKIPKGAEAVYNDRARMDIIAVPTPDGGLDVQFDLAYDGILKPLGVFDTPEYRFADFPKSWGVGSVTMPIVFKYVNAMTALLNSKYVSFAATTNQKHPEIDLDLYSDAQKESFLSRNPVMRRGIYNLAALRYGNIVDAKTKRDVAFLLPDDNTVYKSKDKELVDFITSPKIDNSIYKLGDLFISEKIGEELVKYRKTDLINRLKKESDKVDVKKGESPITAANRINSESFVFKGAETINNNAPMASAFENSEKYISSAGIRSMLTPENIEQGRDTRKEFERMNEASIEAQLRENKSKRKDFVKKYFGREALVTTTAGVQKALEKGFDDYILAQFTSLNGQRGNAEARFMRLEKEIYGGLSVEDEGVLNELIFYRRVIQVDANRDRRLLENEGKLSVLNAELEGLEQTLKKADTKKAKDAVSLKISETKKTIKFVEEQIERYSEPIMHGSKIIKLETAQNAIKVMKFDVPEAKMADLESRAEAYFNAYKQILEDSYQAGLIDQETRDRFINDDYSPRVFISKMFENTDPRVFENMGLGEDQIKSIKNGSEGEMFLDTRFLLNASLRSLEKRAKYNEFFNAVNKEADRLDYKIKSDFLREGKYKTDSEGNVIEDSFGNRQLESPDEGYTNLIFKEDGKTRGFQVQSDLYNQMVGIEDRRLMSPTQRRKVEKVTGVRTKKALVTGLSPRFAVVATLRGFTEVTRGRGVYDDFMALPIMQTMAMVDFFKALPNANLNSELAQDYAEHGGMMSFMTNQGRPEKVVKRKAQREKGIISSTRAMLGQFSPLKKAGRVLSYAGETAELGMRLAIYDRMLKKLAKTRPELTEKQRKFLAIEEARLLADFSQGGYLGKDLDAFKPYLNAAIQGTRGTLNYIKKNPKMFSIKAAQSVIIQAGLVMLAKSVAGEYWENISQYIKNRYMLIPLFITKTVKNKKGDDVEVPQFLKIPKAHQFMMLDHLSTMLGEELYSLYQGEDYDWKMYDGRGGFTEQGEGFVDAMLSSLPAGDLLPEEILAPKDLTFNNIMGGIVSNIPVGGMLDSYINNVDRYMNSVVTYDRKDEASERIFPSAEGMLDAKTRDMFKLMGEATARFGEKSISPPRAQKAFEKMFSNETSIIVSAIYNITDAMISTQDEKSSIQPSPELIGKRKKKFEKDLGLVRTFIYEVPADKYEPSLSKKYREEMVKANTERFKIKREIGVLLKNYKYDVISNDKDIKFPKKVEEYILSLPEAVRKQYINSTKNQLKGFEANPIFVDSRYVTPEVAGMYLRDALQIDFWDDLSPEDKQSFKEDMKRAGISNTQGYLIIEELKKER
jgi:hypothetical protein|tara:strand:- start:4583 stop:13459 length:8877 start_codon:yes stop_codon:yes gene_type:complete